MKKTQQNPTGAKANAKVPVVCVGMNAVTPSEKPKAATASRADLKADWSRYADSRLRQFCLR
jgi:hypothetical protein